MADKRTDGRKNSARSAPPLSPEVDDLRLQNLAIRAIESRITNGTATSQELLFYAKKASVREELELERLRQGNRLDEAKISQIGSLQAHQELQEKALRAFTEYQGGDVDEFDDGQQNIY